MYGYKNIVKPELLVEEPIEQLINYPWINTTEEKLVELEKMQQHIVEKKIVKELLLEQEYEPKYVEKKILRELLLKEEFEPRVWEKKILANEILKEEVEPRFWQKKQLLRELLFTEEPKHIEKKILKVLFEQEWFFGQCFPIEKKWIVRELIEKIPTEYVEKKLIRELLFQQEVLPQYLPVEKVLRELLFTEEPKHVEKKILREILFEQESLIFGQCFPVEKKWYIRELLEKLPTEYVEKKLIREVLYNPEFTTFYPIEKILREQIYEQPELITRQFEKLGMYNTMPVVFKYPIDLTQIVESELLCHKVEGRHIFPTSGYLHMVWKSLAKLQGVMEIEKLPVIFEKVEFFRPTIMMIRGTPVKKIFEFKVKIVPTTGLFEIVENEKVIVAGRVKVAQTKRVFETVLPQQYYLPQQQLVQEEIYQELKQLKGIEVEEELKTLVKTDLKCQYGEMLWTGKWIPFLEGLIQMKQFAKRRTTGIMLPRRITQLVIDPIMHQEYVEKKMLNKMLYNTYKYVLPVVYDRRVKKTVVGGIELVELKGMFVPRIEKIEREILFQQQQQQQFYPTTTMYNTTTKVVVPEMYEPTIFGEEQSIEFLLPKLKREFVQYYVEECKRYTEYIVKKTIVEQPLTTTLLRPILPTPLPITLKHLIEKIKYERKYLHQEPIINAIVQGGEFLQLLKCIVEEIHLIKEEHVVRRVQRLLIENLRFYKTLEKDILINMINVKPYFVQVFKTILEQPEFVLPFQPRFLRNTIVPEVTPVVPRFFDLEQRMKMFEEPRFRVFRSPSELVFNKYL